MYAQSCLTLVAPWTVAHQAPQSKGFSRQESWVGYHFLLQGIFLNQGLNPCLLHWQAGSLPRSHLGREWCKDTLVPERNFCLEVTWRTERELEMDEFSHQVMGCYFILPRRKWQPTPVFLPGESQGRRSLVGCRLWGHTESDTTEAT